MSPDRAAQWLRRLERLRGLEQERTARADYAGADRALAARRRAQSLWSRELFRHEAPQALKPFAMQRLPRIVVNGGRMTVSLP